MSYTLSILATLLLSSFGITKADESIIGGVETKPGEIKYQISLQYQGIHLCGGGIIDEQFIVTAAHCIVEDNKILNFVPLTVVVGISNLNDNNGKVEAQIAKAYVPTAYNQSVKSSPGDIAVIKLKTKLQLGAKLSKLMLPKATSDKNPEPSFAGKDPLIVGFGWDEIKVTGNKSSESDEDGSSTGKLLKAKTVVIDNKSCQADYKSITIHNTQLCAEVVQKSKEVPQGICSGDSGGPLVLGNEVIGVVNFNLVGCNEAGKPAVYCRVSSYINFIENAKKDHVTKDMLAASWA